MMVRVEDLESSFVSRARVKTSFGSLKDVPLGRIPLHAQTPSSSENTWVYDDSHR